MATGSLGSTDNRYHVFSTNNSLLTKLGLGNFTKEGWVATVNAMYDSGLSSDLEDEDGVSELLSHRNSLYNFLNDELSIADFTCSKMNTNGSYTTLTYTLTDLLALIDEFEENTIDAAANNSDAKIWLRQNIYPIQSSQQKCLTATFTWPSATNSTSAYIKIYFQDISKASFERVPALRNPLIAATARSSTGLLYDHKKVSKDITDNRISCIYPEKKNGDADPQSLNVLSAPIRLNYNENIGMWESTQQIVAYLLNDIPPPFNPNFLSIDQTDGYLDTESDLEKYSNPSESEYYVSNFTMGLAVPVSCKNNNPYAFTPNFISDRSGVRMEKIKVVNRSTANFNKGQLVLCTLVGSEWLVSEFGAFKEVNLPAKTKFWAFQKLMANSDSFFAMYESRANANSQTAGVLVTVGEYLNEFRKGYYKSWLNSHTSDNSPTANSFNDIAELNAPGYAGGYKYRDPYYYYTNSSDAPYYTINIDEILPEVDGWRLPMFFGPVFPDGYGVVGLRNIGETEHIATNGKNLAADEAVYGWGPEFLGQDRYARNECIEQYINNADLYQGSIDLRNLDRDPLDASAYAAPTNPSRIQFAPLSVEAVIHADNWATEVSSSQDRRYNIKLDINNNPQTYGAYSDATKNQFASIINRNPLHSQSLSTSCSTYDAQPGNNWGFAYDCFVKREASSVPIGVPRTFNASTDGLNFVGITFAMQRITKSGGGQINFDVINQIGIPGWTIILGGSVTTSMFGPPVIDQPRERPPTPTWGSTTDLYNSFGTTALHCMVFDAWPIEDTIYDPAYFSVMHFNSRTEDEDGVCEVDFKVPTLTNGSIAQVGATDRDLLPKEDWVYDKIRRGQLLTGNGFQYYRRNLRLSSTPNVLREGTNIPPQYQYENKSNKISFKYSNGSAVWDTDPDGIIGELRGFDMTPNQFSDVINVDGNEYDGFIVEIPSLDEDGDSEILQFTGVVEDTYQIDYGPANHSNGIIRLSSPSDNGTDVIFETRSSSVEVAKNSTNEYDVFYYFHNDVTHTIFSNRSADRIPGYLQYLILTMN